MKNVAGFHSPDFGFFCLFSFDLLSGFGINDFQKDTSTTGIELEKRTPRWIGRSNANRAMEIRRPAGSKSSLERACKLILRGRKRQGENRSGRAWLGFKGWEAQKRMLDRVASQEQRTVSIANSTCRNCLKINLHSAQPRHGRGRKGLESCGSPGRTSESGPWLPRQHSTYRARLNQYLPACRMQSSNHQL